MKTLTPAQQQKLSDNLNFYELSLRNVGGLIMPVIVQMTFDDGSQEVVNIPAEIWRKNNTQVTKVITTPKQVISFRLDPYLQTADTDLSNNTFPRQPVASRFELFQQQQAAGTNPLRESQSQPAVPASPLQQKEQKPVSSPGGSR